MRFTLSTISALAFALPLADLPFASAAHSNGLVGANALRRHHARMANGHVNVERAEIPRNAVLAKKMAQKKSTSYKIKKRGDGSVCKVRESSRNSTTSAVSSTAASSTAASSAATSGASSVASSAASSVWSSVLPTTTDATSTAIGDSWAVVPTSSAQVSSAAVSSSQAAATSISIESPTSTSAAAAQTSSSSNSGSSYSGSYTHLIPNGKKAGISAGDSFDHFKDYIGWWYDWTADPQGHSASGVTAMNMIWGAGSADGQDAQRLQAFKSLSYTPAYIIGYEEPDCEAGSGSAGFDVGTGISLWNELVGPKKAQGSVLVAPSMCKQAAESGWLGPFMDGVAVKPDIINLHINKNSKDGINMVLDHYWNTYKLPMMVTEFACVNDVNGFTACENQSEIDSFIHTIVDILENDSRVVGYAFSSGIGLGGTWKLMASSSGLSATGQSYLDAISKFH